MSSKYLVSVIGVDDESIEMSVLIVLATDVLVDEKILSLVVEDNMNLLGTRAADIRSLIEREQTMMKNWNFFKNI